MSRRAKPSLEELQRDLLHRTRELRRALIAPEGSIEAPPASAPEQGTLAVNKGLQKLRRRPITPALRKSRPRASLARAHADRGQHRTQWARCADGGPRADPSVPL
jgi:hypothetical protein